MAAAVSAEPYLAADPSRAISPIVSVWTGKCHVQVETRAMPRAWTGVLLPTTRACDTSTAYGAGRRFDSVIRLRSESQLYTIDSTACFLQRQALLAKVN